MCINDGCGAANRPTACHGLPRSATAFDSPARASGVQTTPHLFGWLVFRGVFLDNDKTTVISQHEEVTLKGSLAPYFEAIFLTAMNYRLMASTAKPVNDFAPDVPTEP